MIDLKQPLKKIFMMGMLMLLMPLSLIAQDITVKGVVKDATGETVIGATVMQKGTSNGAVTDIDGNFTFESPLECHSYYFLCGLCHPRHSREW